MQNPPLEPIPSMVIRNLEALSRVEKEKTFWVINEFNQLVYTGTAEQRFAEFLRERMRRSPYTCPEIRDYILKTLNNPPEKS